MLAVFGAGCGAPGEKLDFGTSNADVLKAFAVAKDEASGWHANAIPGSLHILAAADGQPVLETYFYGKRPFQRYTDVLTVQVNMSNAHLISSEEAKGSLEPNYDGTRPVDVTLRTDWHSIRTVADSAYGTSFKQHFADARTVMSIEADKQWWVTYHADSSGAYAQLRVWDAAAHAKLAGTFEIMNEVDADTARTAAARRRNEK